MLDSQRAMIMAHNPGMTKLIDRHIDIANRVKLAAEEAKKKQHSPEKKSGVKT